MAQSGGKRPSGDVERVTIDPKAQAAVVALLEKERRRKARHKRYRIIAVVLLLMGLTQLPGFYCRYIMGTNYEAIIVRTYPHFSEKAVRAAVITDRWYVTVFGPLIERISSREEIEFRRSVIELGLATTGEAERTTEKIQNLRDRVAAGMAGSPERGKKGMAFAVYELPPAKGK